MIGKNTALLLLACAAPIAQQAHAQIKCTMPNGVVITQQLGECPRGATKAQGPDGKLLALPPPLPSPAKRTPAPQTGTIEAHQAATRTTPAPPQPSAYDYAQVICQAFEQAGASTCDVNSNVFSESTIETTLAISAPDALITCKDVAASMRAKTKVFETRPWKILIFSPYSGNRPTASCKL